MRRPTARKDAETSKVTIPHKPLKAFEQTVEALVPAMGGLELRGYEAVSLLTNPHNAQPEEQTELFDFSGEVTDANGAVVGGAMGVPFGDKRTGTH